MAEVKKQTLLIAAPTPQFLARGVLWFQKNQARLQKKAKLNSFVGRQLIWLETGQQINLFQLLRQLGELGYERVQTIGGPGEFSQVGDTLKIFPINRQKPWLIQFLGRQIEVLHPLKLAGQRAPAKKIKAPTIDLAATLLPGDYVVHLDHGIGIFQKIVRQDNRPYFYLRYAKKDKLFVPLKLAVKISPYLGLQKPRVHRLGGNLWSKTKRRVKADAVAFARQLIALCAQRQNCPGIVFPKKDWLERELASDFTFAETPDQQKAIGQVLRDMEKGQAMDRLVCGDVGFGKTEVALRAAFKAALGGWQTILLAPTTILARQHFLTFSQRLEKFAVRTALLSRLQSKTEQQKIAARLQAGKIDIIIGTHRLLQKDIAPPKLGLLIIDEEQRFGVRQKEKLKKIKANVDVLSLSATPIPRTLHLALAGLRAISQIKTPPPGRLPVKTFVLPFGQKIVKRAIDFELRRRGQVYFLHNRVATIGLYQQKLQQLFPRAKIANIHGRLPEQELVETVEKFRQKKIDILVATTIIENGLDFPQANTLIVADASLLGLAQAYQLRGRVGRAQKQALAYFLYPAKSLTKKARQRLKALRQAQALGSGYNLALKDLEIRGTGNILGREQSGAANKVGLNLYFQLLAEAVEKLRQQKKPAI